MSFDKSKAPYYVQPLDDDYTELLFLPGLHLQNRELNESQVNAKKIIRGVADCFLTDGDIRNGCEIIINDKVVSVTDGKIYLEGVVRSFKKQDVNITGVGTEVIGVRIDRRAVSYLEDNRLISPASGYQNYSLPGAERLKETLVLAVNDENATSLFVLEDGQLLKVKKDEDDTFIRRLMELLAERTYDESGHYTVSGLELSQKNQYENDRLYLSLSEGKAYIEGWAVKKNAATTIPVMRSTDTREISAEPKTYTSGTNKYKLNNHPAKDIKRVVSLNETTTAMTRQGAVNGTDPIPSEYTPVVSITEISQTSGTKYTKNVDYVLEGNSVRWVQGGKQPELGASYNIKFQYNKTMRKDTDYKLVVDNNDSFLDLTSSGAKPVANSQINIDYTFYLHYINTIAMDKDGKIHVIPGQSDSKEKIAPADITNQNVLILGYVQVAPNNDHMIITNSMSRRSEMKRIQRMYERIEESEINQAITNLDKEAMENEQATLLKGIVTDGFIGWTKADINHDEFNASINPVDRYLTVGFTQKINKLNVDTQKTVNASYNSKIATAKGTEKLYDRQPFATESHLINPYTVFPEVPSVVIEPASDNWIDERNIVIQRDGGTIVNNVNVGVSSSRTETSTRVDVLETAIEYMRNVEIKVNIKKFTPRQQGIRITFNDVNVTMKPESSKYQGTDGLLVADEYGEVRASFTIPSKTRCGTVDVKVFCKDYPDLIGVAPFTSLGTLRTNTTTITTTKIVTKRVDPVSQTFEFNTDQMLTSIGVYFSVIETKYPVTLQIRETINGYPADVVLAEKVLDSKDLKYSDNADVETKIKLDNPVYCRADTQYCFTILTKSTTSSIYVQKLGSVDLTTKQIVARNPYIQGVMFTSSNALTWTAHQNKNIKFNLYVNDYVTRSEVYFYTISNIDFDNISIRANTSVPLDCTLNWEYSSNGGSDWLPIAINRNQSLTKRIDSALVRAIITTTGMVSPTIDLESLIFVGSKNAENSNYVSKNITTDNNFTEIKVIVDVYSPSGTGVVFYYATDIVGKEWKTLTQSSTKVLEEGGYVEYTYGVQSLTNVKNFRVKAKLTTNNSTITPRVKNLKCILK